jgi:hypothetical protein
LEKLNLTYTQYITMLVLWERRQVTVKQLGEIPLSRFRHADAAAEKARGQGLCRAARGGGTTSGSSSSR